MCAHAVTVNDVLDGHVALDIRSLDRIYLNAYVPNLADLGPRCEEARDQRSLAEYRARDGGG